MRRAAALLVLAALAGAPAVRFLAPDAFAQDKDKKDKDEKEAERKRKEEEEKRRREEEQRKKAFVAIAAAFAAKDANGVLKNVADGATVELKLSETAPKDAKSAISKVQARGVLESFFKEWKVVRVDTNTVSVDQNAASFKLELFKDSAEGKRMGKRIRIKVGSADDRHPLVKLVVEW